MRRLLTLAAAGLTLSACAMGPADVRPALPVPASLPQGPAYPALPATATTDAAALDWRQFFTDPKLRAVIEQALAGNRDLRVSVLNITAARAQYRIQRADLLPTVDAGLSGSITHTPTSVYASQIPAVAAGGAGLPGAIDSHIYSATLGVSGYELDLWGRVRSLTREAYEQYLSTAEARRAAQISLVAEVATAYLTLGADRQRLAVAQDTLSGDADSLRLTQARFQAGEASGLDVSQAQTAAEQARSAAATYTAQAAQDENALNLLAGGSIAPEFLPDATTWDAVTQADVPAGLDSRVLLNRPDVLQGEHALRAQNADIGAARAAFFPTIALTGSGGSTATELSRLFQAGTGSFSFTPSVTLPIFDLGRLRARLAYSKVQRDIAVAQYEKAVQTAFRETADALAARKGALDLLQSQTALVAASQQAFDLAQARYKRGVDAYLTTLTSQLALYSAQQTLISARLNRAANLVTLYRVLGGGWTEPAH